MYKQRLRAACVVAGLSMAWGGSALADGFYFGLSGGVTSVDVSKNDFDELFTEELSAEFAPNFAFFDVESTLDDSDKGWGLQVGYRWGRYIAAEVGYVDLGEARYESQLQFQAVPSQPSGVIVTDADIRFQSTGPTVSLLGMFPINEQFDLHARAGLYFGDTRARVRSVIVVPQNVPGAAVSREVKSSSSDLFFGVGATWNINDSYSVRVEYQRFADVGDSDEIGEADVDLITVGFLFR